MVKTDFFFLPLAFSMTISVRRRYSAAIEEIQLSFYYKSDVLKWISKKIIITYEQFSPLHTLSSHVIIKGHVLSALELLSLHPGNESVQLLTPSTDHQDYFVQPLLPRSKLLWGVKASKCLVHREMHIACIQKLKSHKMSRQHFCTVTVWCQSLEPVSWLAQWSGLSRAPQRSQTGDVQIYSPYTICLRFYSNICFIFKDTFVWYQRQKFYKTFIRQNR